MLRLTAKSRVETRQIARALGRVAVAGTVIGLEGDLGAGKTFFVEALARGLGLPRDVPVTSPTFTLVHVLPGGRLPLVHVDLYRLEKGADIDELGLDEWLPGPGVTAVEWWSRMEVPRPQAVEIELQVRADLSRRLRIGARGPTAVRVVRALQDALEMPRGGSVR